MTLEGLSSLSGGFSTFMIMLVIGAFALTAIRLIKGPSYADRFIAIDMMTGLAVAACALTALATGRDEFLDVAFALALIAFVATAAFAAFLERKVAMATPPAGQAPAGNSAQQGPVAGSNTQEAL